MQIAVKTQIEFIMKHDVGNLCKIFVLAVVAIILNGCAINDLNKISVKKIKNEITGKTEKYGLIKVFEDEQDDHFLEVKIPEDYEEAPTQYGSFLTVYRFSKGEANQYTREGLMISKTTSSEISDINRYAAWIDQSYQESKGKPILKDYSHGHEYGSGQYKTKTYTLKYIFPCSYMKAGAVCFSGQKEVDIIKILKPDNVIWAIEYSNSINPLNNNDYEKTVKEKFEEGQKIIEDCCKILVVKKTKKN